MTRPASLAFTLPRQAVSLVVIEWSYMHQMAFACPSFPKLLTPSGRPEARDSPAGVTFEYPDFPRIL